MTARLLEIDEQHMPTGDGWELHLRRTVSPADLDRQHAPLLIVPGYGMNSFIFSFHPRGTSIERTLAEAGFEVWSMNLRGHGPSRPAHPSPGPQSLLHYASVDVPTAIDQVLIHTQSQVASLGVTLIGCSLGGTVAYGYLALQPDDHRVGKLIAMGAPLRWARVHPMVRALFSSPRLAGAVRISRTRAMARSLLPLAMRAPVLLSFYMNTRNIDTDHMTEMTRTVEDPHPGVNRDIAHWIRKRDLELDGINVTRAMNRQSMPLLVVLANRDGLVPEATAMSAIDAWGGDDVEVLRAGDRRNWYAHANLFIANDAPSLVFHPMIRWLRR